MSYEEIINLFDQAEAQVKKLELLTGELAIPPINELRYAGHHLTKALSQDLPEEEAKREVQHAESHCKRAIYDAKEIAIIYLLEQAQSFQSDYKDSTNITTILPNYINLCKQVGDIFEFLHEERNYAGQNRDKYYDKLFPHYENLRDIVNQFNLARPEINKLDESKDKSERKATRRFIIFVLISALGLILAAIRLTQPIISTPPS